MFLKKIISILFFNLKKNEFKKISTRIVRKVSENVDGDDYLRRKFAPFFSPLRRKNDVVAEKFNICMSVPCRVHGAIFRATGKYSG